VLAIVVFKEVWSMNSRGWFPGIVTFRVPFPFHKVLELSHPTLEPVVDDMLYLVFLMPFDHFRGRSCKIGAMNGVFLERRKK
jgi:hypothetical protein